MTLQFMIEMLYYNLANQTYFIIVETIDRDIGRCRGGCLYVANRANPGKLPYLCLHQKYSS